MTNDGSTMMLALKKRSLKTQKDILAVLELQTAGLGAYAPAGKVVELEQTKLDIARVEEEIAELEANGESDNPSQSNHGKRKYTDALLDVQVGLARTTVAIEAVGTQVSELAMEVRQHTGRLNGIEGYLRAADAVRDTVRFAGGC